MTVQFPPSRNPTDNDSLIGLLNLVLTKFLQSVDDMLPAQVVAYDRESNTAQVQPMISIVTTGNTILNRSPVLSVPVYRYGGGNAVLSFNLAAGDLGWLKANDRDISLYKQTWGMAQPNTARKHSFSDAMFFPDKSTGVTINSNHTGDAVIQTPDGTSCAALMTSNAVMDLSSTTKAFGFPAMSTSQKNAISSPRAGFAVFDTTEGGISVYNGSMWS